jgi:hypothetical protein
VCSCSVNNKHFELCDSCKAYEHKLWKQQAAHYYDLRRVPAPLANYGIDREGRVYAYNYEVQQGYRDYKQMAYHYTPEDTVESYRETYEQMAVTAAEKLAKIAKLPVLAELPPHTTLFVSRVIDGKPYAYLFLLVEDDRGRRWYQTGQEQGAWTDALLDARLIRWELAEISIVTEWTQVY